MVSCLLKTFDLKSNGTLGVKSRHLTRCSAFIQQVATPNPAKLDMKGSTTFNVATVATTASKALPPFFIISAPAADARGWAEATMPPNALEGECVKFIFIPPNLSLELLSFIRTDSMLS